jgi:hypothetical protein
MGEIEQNTKRIIENLKNVQAVTVDLSYYHNGTPSAQIPTIANLTGYDRSEHEQHLADKFKDTH